MSRPQVTVRRVGRRPTANRNAVHAHSHLKPRSGDRYLARGVSPGDRANKKGKAPEGRQMYAVRWWHTTHECAGGTPAPQRPRPNCGAGVSPAHFGHWGELPR